LDGSRSLDDILRLLSGEIPKSRILSAMDTLGKQNMLREGIGEDPHIGAYWELAGECGFEARGSFKADVRVVGGIHEAEIRSYLQELGVHQCSESPLMLAITDNYLDPAFGDLNEEALSSGRPWLVARPFGRCHWIGPLFLPGLTACWKCLESRLAENGWTPA